VSDVVYLDVCCLKRPFDDQRSTEKRAREILGH